MKLRRVTALAILTAAAIGIFTPAVMADEDASLPENCQQSNHAVQLSPSDPTEYNLVGWLCYRGALDNKTVQVAISGLTYDHYYWQWPDEVKDYSYVREATKQGYAVFAIDRLGTGLSDHPLDPNSLTTQSHSYVVHQLVQKLRAGGIGNHAFNKVILTGHSFGSQVIKHEAATYHDIDGALITGSLRQNSPNAFTIVAPTLYPAQFDPKFASSGLPLGYLTTQPGTRGNSFYNAAIADPAVIAQDETLKQTATTGEFATVTAAEPLTPQIDVPVLLVMGEKDLLFCDENLSCADSTAVMAREAAFYSPQACLEAFVLPEAGHSINQHYNAQDWFAIGLDWADRRVGTKNHAPTDPCLP